MTAPRLRERKKAKIRRAIAENAIRLFSANGYEQTTVDEICAAAEVSQSTFFRYYPTKEHVILDEDHDPVMVGAFKRLPTDQPLWPGLREAVSEELQRYPASADEIRTRTRLAFAEPGLRARRLEHGFATQQVINSALAARSGSEEFDLELHTLSAAIVGAWSSALYLWALREDGGTLADDVDRALRYVEAGLPIDKPGTAPA